MRVPATQLVFALLAVVTIALEGPHAAAAPRADLREPPRASGLARDREVYIEKVLAVIEPRLANRPARTRTAEKLATLSDRQLRLMAALADRVTLGGDAPANGIALFLLTALLILS